ncbi:MAG TPA: S9 family peptidase [Bryobacteraceae bacterium]|nr:S9 family peptidase [Bryobacteraceae bacterium]
MRRFLFLLACGAIALAQTQAQNRPGITAEDYLSFAFAADPQLSPDGQWVAYTVATIDQKANKRVSRIWIVPADGSQPPSAFTGEAASSTSPRWSPDGRSLAFLSARDGGRPQIWMLSRTGGEARRVSNLENGASSFEWSPDGTRFVCLTRTGPPPSKTSDVRHYTHIYYKFNDTGYFDEKRSHIVVIDLKTGAAKQITDGNDWNDLDPHWSPDSTRIVFVSNRTGKEFDLDHNSDVWAISADGGALTKISDHAGPDTSPRWSPDGTRIAFLGAEDEEAAPMIYVAPSAGGKPSVVLNRAFDQTATELMWAEHGRALYFGSGVKGETHLYRIDALSGAIAAITKGARAVRSASLHEASGRLAYTVNDFAHLDDLYVREPSGAERQLTHLNAALWDQRALASVERIPYTAADGWAVDGFLVKPIGFDPSKKYPMVLSIHGGPAGMYGVDWYHEFQVYAARGWAVFFCNPRGSTGYGRKFQRGVVGEWGGKAYTDIITGVEEALKRNPWIDRDRLGVTGGSYGGYMTNWITTQTNLFKAAVTLRSIANFVSDDGTRDGAYGHKTDFGGDIFQNYEAYWNYSPLHYASKVKTPTLVLHSDNDYRVPIEQGEQWFRALQHFGVVSELVMFPRENHNLTRTGEPKHLVESLKWQCYWFDRFLNGNAAAKRPNEE